MKKGRLSVLRMTVRKLRWWATQIWNIWKEKILCHPDSQLCEWCCTLIWCRLQLTDHPAKGVGVLSLQKCLTSENTAVPGMYRPTSLYLMTDLSIPFMRHPVRNSQTISIVLFSTSIQWIWKNPFELCELGKL